MQGSLLHFLKRSLTGEPPLHPVEVRQAESWIKRRLVLLYPKLRDNPKALEIAYRQLTLRSKKVETDSGNETVFELMLPED